MRTTKRITIKHVAEYAGVSIGAVSKVLHGGGGTIRVSDAKAEVIRQAAQILQYRPNHHARSLRSGQTRTFALAASDRFEFASEGLYYGYLVDRLVIESFRRDYSLMVSHDVIVAEGFDDMMMGRYDGMIWTQSWRIPKFWEIIEQSSLPHVVINSSPPPGFTGATVVRCDDSTGIRSALEHLVQLNHRSIAYLSSSTQCSVEHTEARWGAMVEMGRTLGINVSEYSERSGAQFIENWLASGRRETAVLTSSDAIAGQVLRAASREKVSIPKELSIVGFDSTPFASWTSPPLTSIKNPLEQIAQISIDALIQMVQSGDRGPKEIVIPSSFDVRYSTADLAAQH